MKEHVQSFQNMYGKGAELRPAEVDPRLNSLEAVTFSLNHLNLRAPLRPKLKYLGAMLVDPVRRQNFAGKLSIRFYNI